MGLLQVYCIEKLELFRIGNSCGRSPQLLQATTPKILSVDIWELQIARKQALRIPKQDFPGKAKEEFHSISTVSLTLRRTQYRGDLDDSKRANFTTMMSATGGCDESKCVSKGRGSLYNNSFTCYGDDGTNSPRMCADGYLPLTFGDQGDFVSNTTDIGDGNDPLSYFTCCSPQHQFFTNSTDVVRQCSDPVTLSEAEWYDDSIINSICENDSKSRTIARRMKASSQRGMRSILCCDSVSPEKSQPDDDEYIIIDAAIPPKQDFAETLECVPYRNKYYQASNAQNQIGATNAQNEIGMLRPIYCDMPGFSVPRPFGNETIDDVAATGRYQCCRDGSSLPPFAQDDAYRITLYPAFGLFCVAAVLSAIAVVGLLIPLLVQICNGRFRKENTQTQHTEPRYNSYNLYLVYRMSVDLAYCLFQVFLYGSTIWQRFNPGVHGFFIPPTTQNSLILDPFVEEPYFFMSVWFNAIICYQILLLLKSSRSVLSIEPPSLKRITLHAGITFLFALVIGSSSYFLENGIQEAELTGDIETQQLLLIVLLVFGTILALPPILYMMNGACIIWWRGYVPSLTIGGASESDKSMRELAFYFFRIVVVFLVIFLVVMGLILYASIADEMWVYTVTSCLLAVQPTITFCLILTKPDTRQYIFRLVTLSYLFGKNSCFRSNASEPKKTPRNRSTTTKIPYGDSNNDSSSGSSKAIEAKPASAEIETNSAHSRGRYMYTSRRISNLPSAILPTGEMVSMTYSTTRPSSGGMRIHSALFDQDAESSKKLSPGMSSIDTTRNTATFSDDE